MTLELSNALQEKIQSLGNTATRMSLPEGTNSTTMKNRILRVAAELGMPVTVRKIPGGLLFWRSTDEDLQQAKAIVARFQSDRQPQQTTWRAHPGRRRRG
jgi:hypothetical protein